MNDRWKAILQENRGRMSAALRDAVLGGDAQMCANGCQAILWFREYDLTAALLSAAEDAANPQGGHTAGTLLELADLLYQEISSPRDYRERRDPQLVRRHVVTALEGSVSRFPQHRRNETVEAFLMLVSRDSAVLRKILNDPRDGSYLAVADVLSHSARPGVMRLLLGFLDDPHAPSSALTILAHRGDLPFVTRLLGRLGESRSDAVDRNLKHMEAIAWLGRVPEWLDAWDEAQQRNLVRLLMASGVNRLAVFKAIQLVMSRGRGAARREACAALAEFNGADANALVLRALEDPDPHVQAVALGQLRQRGIPGAMSRLIAMTDSQHDMVRDAARVQLEEFTIDRYLAAFDALDHDVRRATAALVRRVDPHAVARLRAEMSALARSRRLRGISAAQAMGLVAEVQEQLVALLEDDDHMVRTEAARALGECDTLSARDALQAALKDRSVIVQFAARESLEQLAGGAGGGVVSGEW
jgi:HEAT repeat protein